MRISFDLDGTLILSDPAGMTCCEAPSRYWGWWAREPMRAGTRRLFTDLRHLGWDIWIYTTSLRSRLSIRCWLFAHGLRVDGIVNLAIHDRRLRSLGVSPCPSKYPPMFGIDLHVDDSEGVAAEGMTHGFCVARISAGDSDWCRPVLAAAQERALAITGDAQRRART